MEKKRINIVLDLDQTMIAALSLQRYEEEEEEEVYDIDKNKNKATKFKFHTMDNDYVIFERPGLQKFLDYIFSNFNVSIWTAASKDYAIFIAKHCILAKNPKRKLDYIFWSYHCEVSSDIGKGTKDLSLLWKKYKIAGYNKLNTYIIDDYEHVFEIQKQNCIISPAFHFGKKKSEKDNFLDNLM